MSKAQGITRRRFLAISAAATGMAGRATAGTATWSGRALGAEARVDLHGMAPEVLAAVPEVLARIERLFSIYDPGSEVSRLNRTGRLDGMAVEFATLLERCDTVFRATGGRFDPTVQGLWAAYGRAAPLEPARASVGWDRVRREGRGVMLDQGQQVTFNGIAQGFATDLVAAHLRAAGATQVLVNIGEFSALGGPWRLGLSDPGIGVYGWRHLRDAAIATSSPGAMALRAGRSHILDPQDRRMPQWSSVTVEAEDATLADGVSTALCLAGRDTVAEIARALAGVRRVTLVSRAGDVVTL